jgi:hypothetical protein
MHYSKLTYVPHCRLLHAAVIWESDMSGSGFFSVGGSAKTREIVDAISALFEEKDGTRVLGRIRYIFNYDADDYTLTGFLGAYNGLELDLKARTPILGDERAETVLKTLEPFTEEELLDAIHTQLAWDVDRSFSHDNDQEVIEYSVGNDNFAREAVHEIAKLVAGVRS